MEDPQNTQKNLKDRSAHANFRKGLHDYNDGENVTHQLGNDDYKSGANIPDPYEFDDLSFDGSEASGNDFLEDDVEYQGEIDYEEGIDYE